MASAPRYTYIISRNLDPIFALFIGLSAAYTRINREQTEKGFSRQDTLDQLQRRFDIAFGRDVQPRRIGADDGGKAVDTKGT
ncbi:hypothetical protein BDZ85DRAFT_282239 [Elsinoe ampelina]|uniref:Uncharacterized protein n=1 Tax=Elsinoe ampelina TaxID=302913 RepID=A0A6A6GBV7_9PEZI|nr:hypothetical protein BDZ85DRAFT_282239 [Elsinoe ampelina]